MTFDEPWWFGVPPSGGSNRLDRLKPGLQAVRGYMSVVFGTKEASDVLPLSPREERAGGESERGEIDKKRLLSPALSSFFEEERERKCGCALKANPLPNTID